eukprot:CAMPEP_0172664260 /NCGR_PEP_ID=MMETSP1074-20121228/6473_1 /TAXON_ID=2916 /ORGANISM="Ceratium fusus, Strain PA161109" /LENGTH=174 /DNA_ID=CAMNT_0013480379 /DNA_START=488 /DNA_END=1012 /DNA_ORIENTATION=+
MPDPSSSTRLLAKSSAPPLFPSGDDGATAQAAIRMLASQTWPPSLPSEKGSSCTVTCIVTGCSSAADVEKQNDLESAWQVSTSHEQIAFPRAPSRRRQKNVTGFCSAANAFSSSLPGNQSGLLLVDAVATAANAGSATRHLNEALARGNRPGWHSTKDGNEMEALPQGCQGIRI